TCRAHPHSAADELPGGRAVPHRRAGPDAVRPLSRGAMGPDAPPTRQINPQCVAKRVDANRSRRTDRCTWDRGSRRWRFLIQRVRRRGGYWLQYLQLDRRDNRLGCGAVALSRLDGAPENMKQTFVSLSTKWE